MWLIALNFQRQSYSYKTILLTFLARSILRSMPICLKEFNPFSRPRLYRYLKLYFFLDRSIFFRRPFTYGVFGNLTPLFYPLPSVYSAYWWNRPLSPLSNLTSNSRHGYSFDSPEPCLDKSYASGYSRKGKQRQVPSLVGSVTYSCVIRSMRAMVCFRG